VFGFYPFSGAAFSGLANAYYAESVSDAIVLSDAATGTLAGVAAASDTLTLSDAATVVLAAFPAASDTLTLSDTGVGVTGIIGAVNTHVVVAV